MAERGLSTLFAAGAAALVTLGAAREARAYRPFDGTDAAVAEVGELELEYGPAQIYGEGNNYYLITPACVLNLGFAKNIEYVVDFQQFAALQHVPGQAGLRLIDSDMLVKWVIRRGTLQGQHGPSVAVEAGPLFPEAQQIDRFGFQGDLIVSYRAPDFGLHYNAQAAYSRDGELALFTSVIADGPESWRVRPVAELFVEHEFGDAHHRETIYSGLVGAIWNVRDSLSVDWGFRGASVDGVLARELRFGLTWATTVWEVTHASSR